DNPRSMRPSSRCRLFDLHWRDEAIAPRRNRLDVPRRIGVIAEGLAQLGDGSGERVLGDRNSGPDLAEQLLLRHGTFATLDQENQDLQRLRLDVNRLS